MLIVFVGLVIVGLVWSLEFRKRNSGDADYSNVVGTAFLVAIFFGLGSAIVAGSINDETYRVEINNYGLNPLPDDQGYVRVEDGAVKYLAIKSNGDVVSEAKTNGTNIILETDGRPYVHVENTIKTVTTKSDMQWLTFFAFGPDDRVENRVRTFYSPETTGAGE